MDDEEKEESLSSEKSDETNGEKSKKKSSSNLLAVAALLIPVVGAVFTYVYNLQQAENNKIQAARNDAIKEQEVQIAKANALEKFFPYLKKDADPGQQKAAIHVISSLGYKDTALFIAASNPTKESIEAITLIANTADEKTRREALSVLQAISSTSGKENLPLAEQAILEIQKAEPAKGGSWAVVIGGDSKLEAARHEVEKATKLGFSQVEIYHRQNSYRTIIIFGSRDEAQAKLPEIRSRIRDTSYAVSLDDWCANPQKKDNYFECPGK